MVPASGDGLHFSLLNFIVSAIDGPLVLLDLLVSSTVLGHFGDATFHNVVELCCGFDGISTGELHIVELMVGWLRRN